MKQPSSVRRGFVRPPVFMVLSFIVATLMNSESLPVASADTPPQEAAKRVTQTIAHRGASSERPECTLSAIRRAMEIGATAVEVDVRTSRDGQLFLLHDETLDRTTNGMGQASALTLNELQELDAGSWFDPAYRSERIPSLKQAAQECRGRIDLLLDLKEQGDDYDRKVVQVIQKHGDPAKTIIGVRSIAQAQRFRRLLPKARQLGLIPTLESLESFAEVGVDTIRLWPRWLQDSDEPVQRVKASGKQLHLNGTTGELDETIKLLAYSPDSLSSDDPAQLKRALAKIAQAATETLDELPPAPIGSFSIVVLPDTQQYRGAGTKATPDSADAISNRVFEGWTDWIASNLERQRIVFVSHVGDIVDKNDRSQWAFAKRCMDKLHGRVPYGISVGNHDMTPSGDSSLFQEVFPESRFRPFAWYGGCFDRPVVATTAHSRNNANSFQLFDANGMKFIALHLECNAPDDVLEWANTMLRRHRDRRAVITTHMGLGPKEKPKTAQDYFDAPKGRMNWAKCHGALGNSPQQMWDKCFKMHENLFLVCSGDQSRTQAMRQSSEGEHGNRVYELLSDYGSHGLRVMRFVSADNLIEVRTWDPLKRELCESTRIVGDRNQHQFSLTYDMKTVSR
ncbi:MAG: glycerophosphodiester phosphodiesterase family protein [Planctomycetota bacterium]